MELENLPVDYGHFLIALEAKPLLDMALQRIRFKPARATEPIAFRDWREQCLKRKASPDLLPRSFAGLRSLRFILLPGFIPAFPSVLARLAQLLPYTFSSLLALLAEFVRRASGFFGSGIVAVSLAACKKERRHGSGADQSFGHSHISPG
jgi:hypothetical protein